MSSRSGSVCIHGLRYCFPQCFERELKRRFERLQSEQRMRSRPAHRMPLGLLILSRGGVTSTQLQHALAEQGRGTGRRIGECMQKLGYVCEPQITAALALQWPCPVLSMMPQQVLHWGLPCGLLAKFQMLPVHFSGPTRTLHIAFAGDIEYRALLAIEQMLECKTEACLTTPTALKAAFERLQEHPAPSEKQFTGARGPAEMTRISGSYAARLDADNVKLVGCGELAWLRIEGSKDLVNLLFQLPEWP